LAVLERHDADADEPEAFSRLVGGVVKAYL
jgi:hypothetical protein